MSILLDQSMSINMSNTCPCTRSGTAANMNKTPCFPTSHSLDKLFVFEEPVHQKQHEECQHVEVNFDCYIVNKVLVHVRFGSACRWNHSDQVGKPKNHQTNSQTWEKEESVPSKNLNLEDGDHTSWKPFEQVDSHRNTPPVMALWRTR